MTNPQVVYGVNAAYILPALVSIYSLQKNASQPIDVALYLEPEGLEPDDLNLIDKVQDRLGIRHRIFPENVRSVFDGYEELDFRFPTIGLLPLVLPRLVEGRCLFIDADTLVMGDVWKLLDMDMRGMPLEACSGIGKESLLPPRPSKREQVMDRFKHLGFFPSEGNYFNSGVLLMDCHVVRDQFPGWEDLSSVEKLRPFPKLPDQDRLNQFFHGHWFQIPLKWNTRVSIKRYVIMNEPRYRKAPDDLKQQMREAAESPMVWHYMGNNKPWKGSKKHLFWRWTHRAFRDYDQMLAEFNDMLAL